MKEKKRTAEIFNRIHEALPNVGADWLEWTDLWTILNSLKKNEIIALGKAILDNPKTK